MFQLISTWYFSSLTQTEPVVAPLSEYQVWNVGVFLAEYSRCFAQLEASAASTSRPHSRRPLPFVDRTAVSPLPCSPSCFHSDVCVGQSQDDSIVGMKQSKQIPPPLPVSGNLSSSNPDLLQSHHRILDFNNQPGVCQTAAWADRRNTSPPFHFVKHLMNNIWKKIWLIRLIFIRSSWNPLKPSRGFLFLIFYYILPFLPRDTNISTYNIWRINK